MFGPWLMFIFLFISLSKYLNNNLFFIHLSKRFCSKIMIVSWRHVSLGCFLAVILGVGSSFKSASFKLPDDDSIKLVRFAINNTNQLDVFSFPRIYLRNYFSLKTRRAIFHGNGFPFSEQHFREWNTRKKLIDGDNSESKKYAGTWIGLMHRKHYRSLTPTDFIYAASIYKLDWIVIEKKYSQKFTSCNPDFESLKYSVYALSSLRLCSE
jgi:hypothetical protein